MSTCILQLRSATYDSLGSNPHFYEGIDAIFATERTDFGGYSYAYACRILEGMGQEPVGKSIAKLAFKSRENWAESSPQFLLTPVIPNDFAAAKALTLELLKLCEKRGFQKVLLTQFIELKSKQERARHQNFAGILEALNEYSAVSDLQLTLCLDHRYFGYYQEEFLS